jgi:phosphoribosylanthranilate isomerase
MNVIVKICGLTTKVGLDAALACGADMVGFVLYEKSPRHISLELAASLGGLVSARACKVLLAVDASDAFLDAAIAALEPGLLQLHGGESPQRVASIRARFGLPVMKAIAIRQEDDLSAVPEFESVADFLLFDAKPPPGALYPGGHGKSFDWRMLTRLKTQKPWLLAGGLNASNVAQALSEVGAPGVDVSSGVESAPGIKDAAKIAAFIAKARCAAEMLGPKAASG